MILETIVTTLNEDGSLNVAPMGPVVDPASLEHGLERFDLKPFNTSTTYQNLKRTGAGVLHITDDVQTFSLAAVGKLNSPPETVDAELIEGKILANACRYHEFKVTFTEESPPRALFKCSVVRSDRLRDFIGFNRAKHAIIEIAILATRVDFLPAELITEKFSEAKTTVEKTGGDSERRAFKFLQDYVNQKINSPSS